jgi:UDP-3-O-[3-hydroxymyristoyl] glucosamine N-acyltransferase
LLALSLPPTLQSIHAALGGVLHGDAGLFVQRLAPLDTAGPQDMAFVAHIRYAAQVQSTAAGALIVPPALVDAAKARGACIETPDPYVYFARLTQWWKRQMSTAEDAQPAVHSTAWVHPTAQVDPTAVLGPFAVVEAHARIGAHSRVGAHVVLGHHCVVGERGIIHSGVVIGADGFGFAPHEGQWVKIEQLGAVRIGNDVEIGANTCIDRGALDDTVIEDGVKLDNLIQIGHNVHIGAHTAMAGCVGVAGSARIGAYCTVGGGAVVLGHLSLADHVHISAASVVMRSISKPGQYSGVFPIDDNASWEKNAATLRQLHALRQRIKTLEQRP